jgi:hypothetical protein
MLLWVLIIVLLVLALAGTPNWGFHPYGWGPSGTIGVVLIILVILLIIGRI